MVFTKLFEKTYYGASNSFVIFIILYVGNVQNINKTVDKVVLR